MIYRLLILCLVTAFSGMAAEELGMQSLTSATVPRVIALMRASNGNPVNPKIANPEGMVGTHLARIEAENPYHLVTFSRGGEVHAAIIQGQMPVTGYNPEQHGRIITKFAELLGTDSPGRGLSTIVPIWGEGVPEAERSAVYRVVVAHQAGLARAGATLPDRSAGLVPRHVLVLLHPEHPDVGLLQDLGFVSHGLHPEFYDADRVLLSHSLT